jgi:hypothetical protein
MNASTRPQRRRTSALTQEHPAFPGAPPPRPEPPPPAPEPPEQRRAPEPEPSPTAREIPREVAREIASDTPLPALNVDPDDPANAIPSPTQLSVPTSVMKRFEAARGNATTHTGLVLDALRAKATELPDLVAAARPAPSRDDLFPFRATPTSTRSPDRPVPLRVRPTVGELKVIDGLVDWVNRELVARRPGSRKPSRSEVVTAALNAYLPAAKPRRAQS